MKKFIFFARVYTITLVLPLMLSAQDKPTVYPNYVVIGAFAFHDNAIEFSDEANKNSFSAKFEINPNRNLYYVYVLTTHDREMAFSEALRLRTNTKYFDTWVYSGPLGKLDLALSGSGPGEDLNPETGGQLTNVSGEQGQPVSTEAAVNPVLQTGEGALAVNSTDADPSLNAALIAGVSEDKNATKASRRKKRSKGATTGENVIEGQNSALTTTPDNGNQNRALNAGAQTNLQATGQPGNIRSGHNAGTTSQQGSTTGQNDLASAQNSGQTTDVAELNNNQGTGQQGNIKSGQNAGQTSQQGSTASQNSLASGQNSDRTTGIAGQNSKQGAGQQGNLKPGQNTGQTSQQGSTAGQNSLASGQNSDQTTDIAGQNSKQGTAQQGNVKPGQNAGQTSQQGSTDKTTVAQARTQSDDRLAGQNSKQGASQQGNLKPGQNTGQTSQQGSTAGQNSLASGQNSDQTTGIAGQNNKQGTAQQGDVKSGQNAGQTSQQGSTTDKTALASAQNPISPQRQPDRTKNREWLNREC